MTVFKAFDLRRTPARPDLAAEHLRGIIAADRYVTGKRQRIIAPSTPLKREPLPDAPFETEALAGEMVHVYDVNDEGWAWVQLERDQYVGWISANALGAPEPLPTLQVAVPRSFLYPAASIKTEPLGFLSLGARVAVVRQEGAFALTLRGCLHAAHLAPLDHFADDFVTNAEKFIHVPYLWGGKTSLGIDCSGLVQVSLQSAGIEAPRDSDMLEKECGVPLPLDMDVLQRGDLVFWKGHVGIMQDAKTLLHANGHHMMVASEPLSEAVARILVKSYGPITSLRRPAPSGTRRKG